MHASGASGVSTVPLMTSLPLPPSSTTSTGVTYEFNLAPMNGTAVPGWHLTAVQRGLATAVPLAAAVARRRLPRPRTSRSRFGFADKTEARRARCTIVGTALALLAMSMLLVGVTLRLAPLIDDLGKWVNRRALNIGWRYILNAKLCAFALLACLKALLVMINYDLLKSYGF